MNTTEQRAPELHWPAGYPRTPAEERESYPGDISLTRKEAFVSIVDELERWGATDVRISTASTHYKDRPNIPHQHDKPDGVGVVSASDAKTVPPPRATRSRATVGRPSWRIRTGTSLYAWRKRLAERYGVTTADSEFETARLPPGDEDESVVVAGGRVETPPAHEVSELKRARDAPRRVASHCFGQGYSRSPRAAAHAGCG